MKHVIDFSRFLPELCAQRCSAPSFFGNGDATVLNPRIIYIQNLLRELGIEYVMDSWTEEGHGRDANGNPILQPYHFHNIHLMGTTNCIVTAHHDIVNVDSDNCNDNSASVINAIAAKVLNPELTVVITDCEEFGGRGAQRLSNKIYAGDFGQIDFILNLELTAVGGMNFFTEHFPESPLFQKIQRLFPNTPVVRVPFHDGVVFRRNHIDSVVINPVPLDEMGRLDLKILGYCHSPKDRISLANYDDMDTFVRNVITPIIK